MEPDCENVVAVGQRTHSRVGPTRSECGASSTRHIGSIGSARLGPHKVSQTPANSLCPQYCVSTRCLFVCRGSHRVRISRESPNTDRVSMYLFTGRQARDSRAPACQLATPESGPRVDPLLIDSPVFFRFNFLHPDERPAFSSSFPVKSCYLFNTRLPPEFTTTVHICTTMVPLQPCADLESMSWLIVNRHEDVRPADAGTQ